MSRSSEARFWQAVGIIVGVAGGLLLSYTFGMYGLASIDHRALQYGMAASFVMLAGAAMFIAGRTLHVEETVLTPLESQLWNVLAAVCLVGGVITVALAKFQHAMILDRLATGMAGSFALMLGILCLVGQRVMAHMHDVLVASKGKEGEKSTAAGA